MQFKGNYVLSIDKKQDRVFTGGSRMNILDHSKAHQRFFEEMTKIPHGSFHEQAYSEYLIEFAQAHHFHYVRDNMNNVVIYVPGTSGYEKHETVILQAHIDMVCEKNRDAAFDFEHDALKLRLQDGWLSAEGTTLGADDGCGVAYMLAIMDSDTIAHPPLECVFTVQEEVGLFGALGLDKDYISGKRLINLDDGGEFASGTTSAGGVNVIAKRVPTWQDGEKDAYELLIGGLKGGHSGGEIHKERGNANKLAARILYAILNQGQLNLAHVEGGMKDNAIPREASAIFTTSLSFDACRKIVEQAKQEMLRELEFSDADLQVTLTKTKAARFMSEEDSHAFIEFMRLIPNGMRHHSMSIEGLTTASSNAAVVTCDVSGIMINTSVRGALESYIDTIAEEIEILARLCGFETKRDARYPAWSYDQNSEMRSCLQKVCKERFNKELVLMAVHGGLECGVFKMMDPDMDIVTMGPIMKDIHTPKERLWIESFDRTFDLLCAYLKEL